jgi:hypothetical protein
MNRSFACIVLALHVACGGTDEASTCSADAMSASCCCDGDVSQIPMCGSTGALTCAAGFQLYSGSDCTRPHGPCMVPEPDTGTREAASDGH